MARLSKNAIQLIARFGDTTQIAKLTREIKAKKRAEKELKLADNNITKILKDLKKKGKK